MRDATAQPYVGPRPFDLAEQALFFGRDREADDLLGLIMFHRTVLLYAQLGSHVSRAARIEPITPPGRVYASQAFVAIAAAYGVRALE